MISATHIINSLKKTYIGSTYEANDTTTVTIKGSAWISRTQGVVIYATSGLKAKVFTVSATGSITFGSEYSVDDSSKYAQCIYCPAQNKVLVVYGDDDTTPGLFSRTLTVSGTSITIGSQLQILGTTSYTQNWDICYDPVLEAVHIVYLIDLSGYKTYIRYVYGSTLGIASTARLIEASALNYANITYDVGNSKVVLSYYSSGQYGRVASVSGTTYTWGTAVSVNSSVTSCQQVNYDSKNNKVIFLARKSNQMSFTPCTVSGTTLTVGTTTANTAFTAYYLSAQIDSYSNRIFCLGGTGPSAYWFLAYYLTDGSMHFTEEETMSNTDYPGKWELSAGFGRIAHFEDLSSQYAKLRMIQIS